MGYQLPYSVAWGVVEEHGASMADHPVFISYARNTSAALAEALHRELGGDTGLAFLDTSDIETLQKFPAEISDALLAAKVVVVFADETYFTRWYCLREFETALATEDTDENGSPAG
jgi:hypothetical protein